MQINRGDRDSKERAEAITDRGREGDVSLSLQSKSSKLESLSKMLRV